MITGRPHWLSVGLLACCMFFGVSTALVAQQDSPPRDKAIDLLQSAATQSALGNHQQAEQFCRQLLESPELLEHVNPARVRVLLASLLRSQGKQRDAYDVLVATLEKQRADLSPEHPDIQQTLDAFQGLVINLTWDKAVQQELEASEYDAETTLAKQAASMDIPHAWWSLALLQLRQDDAAASLGSIVRSLELDRDSWLGQFSILAMALAKTGQDGLARDAYSIVADRAAKYSDLYQPIQILHNQAGKLLGVTNQEVLDAMSRQDAVDSCSRLIDAYPGIARLHAWRASHLTCLGQDDAAHQDLEKAAQLAPTNWRFAEALTALKLMTAKGDEQTAVCNDFNKTCLVDEQYGTLQPGGPGMDLVVLCSLASHADLDRQKILRRAEDNLKVIETRPFLELAHGMALYRAGRYDDALKVLPGPDAESGFGKDRGLPIIFRAMVFHQLGEKRAAASLLENAEGYYERLFSGDRVTRFRFQDAGTHRCMLTLALTEARSLIGSGKQSD